MGVSVLSTETCDAGVVLVLSVDGQFLHAKVLAVVRFPDVVDGEVAAADKLDNSDTNTELSSGASIHDAGTSPVYVVVNGLPNESIAVNV